MDARPSLIVFLKPPVMGRVKTRLAAEIGHMAATRFYRHQAARLLRELGRDPRWRLVAAIDIAPGRRLSGLPLAGADQVTAQGPGDLGARMARALAAAPPGPAAILGSDIPGVTRAAVADALHLLGAHDAVIGPSPDGGYWLLGLKRLKPYGGRFEGVRWSCAHALADTVAALPDHFRIGYARALRDVDTAADWRAAGG